MSLTKTGTAASIINRAAVELGFVPLDDPYATNDPVFVQLRYLLNTAGEELAYAYSWEFLNKSHKIITAEGDSGDYPLPDDFLYMLNQTGWEESSAVPLGGPLSAQSWAYLKGRNLVTDSIYASFRIREGLFSLFPQPPAVGLDVNFEYQSKNWVIDYSSGQPVEADEALRPSDLIVFDRVLISRYLKVKFMEAKGLESSKAQDDFYQQFATITNKDKGAEILNAGRHGRGIQYLSQGNIPQSGYGGV